MIIAESAKTSAVPPRLANESSGFYRRRAATYEPRPPCRENSEYPIDMAHKLSRLLAKEWRGETVFHDLPLNLT
jgi:hypothetical protein